MWGDDDRAATPLVGNILLVAVALVIAVLLVTFSFAFLEQTGTPTADAAFEYERTPAGMRLIPQALGTDAIVQLNGQRIATIDADEAGQSVLVPTAPDDTITVVSRDENRDVLVSREIDDRSEIGDFIAYYRFDSGSGDTLVDRSGNDNDGDLRGDPDWLTGGDTGLRFDGSNDYVEVSDISSPVEVDEFTVAVAYRQSGAGSDDVGQLVEHTWNGGADEWFVETRASGGTDPYRLEYAVEYPTEEVVTDRDYAFGDRHVAVATYDGDEYDLYVDGEEVANGTHDRSVDMGDMTIARDFESDIQYLDGDVYEIRLYYTAFDDDEVAVISRAMS